MSSSENGSGVNLDLIPRGEGEEPEDYGPLLQKIARKIVERQLTVPALIFLESIKPLSFIGNQLLVFLNPLVSLVVSSGDYYRFVRMIENRENVEKLLVAIEEENARDLERRARAKERKRDRRSSRGFLSSIFGGRRRRGQIPDEPGPSSSGGDIDGGGDTRPGVD